MDDMLVLAPTRWKLKKAVKRLSEVFDGLKLEKHPDKTLIGRIEKGFDFLGYHFSQEGLVVARDTTERFVERAALGEVGKGGLEQQTKTSTRGRGFVADELRIA